MTTDYTKSKAELHRVTTGAVTYQFVIRHDDGWADWAHCTVNDLTGELHVSSNHDYWSYQWSSGRFADGIPNLTAFIAQTSPCYLLGKLSRGEVFDHDATVKAIRAEVLGRRRRQKIGRTRARCAYDAVAVGRTYDYDAFYAAVTDEFDSLVYTRLLTHGLAISDVLGSALIEFVQEGYSPSDRFLRDAVLPALIKACKERL